MPRLELLLWKINEHLTTNHNSELWSNANNKQSCGSDVMLQEFYECCTRNSLVLYVSLSVCLSCLFKRCVLVTSAADGLGETEVLAQMTSKRQPKERQRETERESGRHRERERERGRETDRKPETDTQRERQRKK